MVPEAARLARPALRELTAVRQEDHPDIFPPRITNAPRRTADARRWLPDSRTAIRCAAPRGAKDFQTGEATWKFDDNGDLRVAWEPTTNEEHRVVQFEAIVDQPLVRAGDGSLDTSMFKTHHGWINYMTEYREMKLEAVRNAPAHVAAKQVAWFEAGVVIYRTTIGALLAQSH